MTRPSRPSPRFFRARTRTTRGRSGARRVFAIWRGARCLGVHDAPEIQSALLAMREATAELDAMSIAQSSPSYHRPWWADGEYDEARAEVANDLGVASFAARDWSAAFDADTEAIRLEPRRARLPRQPRRRRPENSVATDARSTTPTPPSSATRPTSKPCSRFRRRRAPPSGGRPAARARFPEAVRAREEVPSTPRPRSRPRESIGGERTGDAPRRSRGGAARRKRRPPRRTLTTAVARLGRRRRRRVVGRRRRLRRQPGDAPAAVAAAEAAVVVRRASNAPWSVRARRRRRRSAFDQADERRRGARAAEATSADGRDALAARVRVSAAFADRRAARGIRASPP